MYFAWTFSIERVSTGKKHEENKNIAVLILLMFFGNW